MIANIREGIAPAIHEVYGDWLHDEDRLIFWDVSILPTVSLCESEDCAEATVDEDGDRVHEGFSVVLKMVFASEEEQSVGCYLIPGYILLSGDLLPAMYDLRVRQEFQAQTDDLEDLREASENIIREFRP